MIYALKLPDKKTSTTASAAGKKTIETLNDAIKYPSVGLLLQRVKRVRLPPVVLGLGSILTKVALFLT